MKTFSGFEYLLIDAANNYGLDKQTFEKRIAWSRTNLGTLEMHTDKAEVKPLFVKAVMAIRKAQKGLPTGHLVGFDAVCSGVQIMSALTGCIDGARATGLIDPDVRADAYSTCTDNMKAELGPGFNVSRAKAKDALMKAMYGSKAEPKAIFGEDTPELSAFYKAAYKTAPGAWELLQDLLGSWQAGALEHSWKLPDGYDAKVKVKVLKEARIEVDELDHATFTYQYYVNEGTKSGLSNAANVIHSCDAYLLRCIHRRCNYDLAMVQTAYRLVQSSMNHSENVTLDIEGKVSYYIAQYERSGIADVVILPYLDSLNVYGLSLIHRDKLLEIIDGMLEYKPFEVVTVHDEFKCHANNMNHLRQQYINILCDLADSELLADLLGQIHGSVGKYAKKSKDLSKHIRNSSYALC
jgi:hypothetical protein